MNISHSLIRSLPVSALTLVVAPLTAEEKQGFYVGADIGGTVAESTRLKEFPDAPPGGTVKFNPGIRLGLNAGYRFNDWLSLGLDTGVMANEVKDSDITVSQVPMMANVELSLPNRSPLEPFIGGGPGFSASAIYVNDDRLNTGSDVDGSAADVVFAWQAYGGVRYNLNDRMSVGIIYRYFSAEEAEWDVRRTSQDIRFGEARVHSFSASFTFKF